MGQLAAHWGSLIILGLMAWGCGRPLDTIYIDPHCGNGTLELGEACDDGNTLSGDGCSANCQSDETCGNYFLDPHEECEDGNRLSCDGCSSDCQQERCGNGRMDCGEICDGSALLDTCATTVGMGQGTVSCTESCRLDVSLCHECGNGFVEAPGVNEECDGAALSGHSCQSLGFGGGVLACDGECRFDDSACTDCGNNRAEIGEPCDGTDLGGQTCQTVVGLASGTLACTASCQLDVSGCFECGTGILEADEECDDGNLDPGDGCSPTCSQEIGWICIGSPSVCTPDSCGNGSIDGLEACDGANLGGETCLSQGHIQAGGAGLACSADCWTYDLTGCAGGAIDGVFQLEVAIAEAHSTPGRERIRVLGNTAPDSYEVTSTIVIDECGTTCANGLPHGVIIEPLASSVCFTSSGAFPIFEVVTGQNEFRGLCFDNVSQAYLLGSGDDAGSNLISHNWFDNTTATPFFTIEIQSGENEILANRFLCQAAIPGTTAIYVSQKGNTIAMNAISGGYDWAVLLTSFPTANSWETSFFDHNSIQVTGAGVGVFINAVAALCYRNNIIYGNGSSTGLWVAGVSFASMANCNGVRGEGNVNQNHAVACTGFDCATHCTGIATGSDLCDLALDPGWTDSELCLQPPTNPPNGLVDSAVVPVFSPYDHNDDDLSSSYYGSGPDVGAREAGTTRYYGALPSACP